MNRRKYRSNHWIVVDGTAKVTIGDEVMLVNPGHSVYVANEVIYRVEIQASPRWFSSWTNRKLPR